MSLSWGERTYVMGILNVTPDSFSGDGLVGRVGNPLYKTAVAQALQFVAAGVDILDIGGQSTRPGSKPVSAEEEAARVVPIIKAVREAVDVLISVDTYHASVAKAALAVGADWVNDVWGLWYDPKMVEVVAEADCPVVIMHNRMLPKSMAEIVRLNGRSLGKVYNDSLADVVAGLQARIDLAVANGVAPENIIIDPGIGFGTTRRQNLRLINNLHYFKQLGYPILLGTSRKGFIGNYLGGLPADDRVEGTAATVAIGIDRGADIVRVHDVKEMVRVARMTDHICRDASPRRLYG
ncbi:MAG: dihydropteroate synthase [Chloroflexota bacterium]